MKNKTILGILAICLIASVTGCSNPSIQDDSTSINTSETTTAITNATTTATESSMSSEATTEITEQTTKSTTELVEETTVETSEEAPVETTAEIVETTEEAPVESSDNTGHEYVHSDEGYFSLIDEGYATTVKTQFSGTCWVTAASTSMESTYLIKYGENINIRPNNMCDAIYTNDKEEGFFLDKGTNRYDFGGYCDLITGIISNGFEGYIIKDASEYELASVDDMKEAIRTHGAMVVSMNDMHADYYGDFDGYYTLNAMEANEYDHAVVIVGWDDNFPREYFVKKPHANGAWLAQNSQGDLYGNGGCFWMSYDTPIIEKVVYEMSADYDHVTSYDVGDDFRISTHGETTTANVFHDEGNLRAVGTYTTKLNQSIHIKICDANMDEVFYEQDASFDYPGYHVIDLDQAIPVKDFSIVITYAGSAPVEGDNWKDVGIEYRPTSNAGESFVLVDGEWIDTSSEEVKDILSIFKQPNNCCIKAIF